MYTINKNYIFINILNTLISSIPLCLIIGNLAVNLVTALICLLGLFFFKKQTFTINNKTFQFLIYSFFIYIVLVTLINNYYFLDDKNYKINLIKSFSYLRFLILSLIITKLIDDNKFNLKLFIISSAFFAGLVSLDLFIQYIFKKNIIGYPLFNNVRATSFFKEELIAGGYVQRFSLFLIFLIATIKNHKNFVDAKIIILFLLIMFPIIFTLNKMPLIIYILSFFLFFLIEKKLKQLIIIILVCIISSLLFLKFTSNTRIISNFKNLSSETKMIIYNAPALFVKNENTSEYKLKSSYLLLFNGGIQLWKENILLGKGFKSYRLNCKTKKYEICSTHPHNYFIELLVDVGVLGLVLIYLILLTGIINFYKLYFKQTNKIIRYQYCAFFLLTFFELFPFRSTGSFFTTANSVYFFLILTIFVNFKNYIK